MLGAKDADNSTSRSGSFETLNILKVANYYQRCGSECATFTKDMNHEVAEGKKSNFRSERLSFPDFLFTLLRQSMFFFLNFYFNDLLFLLIFLLMLSLQSKVSSSFHPFRVKTLRI